MRRCSWCNKRKSEQHEFYRRKSGVKAGQYYPVCKACFRKRGRAYYAANREHFRKLAGAHSERRKIHLSALVFLMKGKPCADCNESYPPWLMDFDHCKGKKFLNVGDLVGDGYSVSTLLREMEKCVVVCANCHRKRTFKGASKNRFNKVMQYLKTNRKSLEAFLAARV